MVTDTCALVSSIFVMAIAEPATASLPRENSDDRIIFEINCRRRAGSVNHAQSLRAGLRR